MQLEIDDDLDWSIRSSGRSLGIMPNRNLEIARMRFNDRMTLQAIGDVVNLSREGVRQILIKDYGISGGYGVIEFPSRKKHPEIYTDQNG